MKKLTAISLLLFANLVHAECTMTQYNRLANEAVLGPVTDLVTYFSPGQCRVKYNITYNGIQQSIDKTYQGDGNITTACQKAINLGRDEMTYKFGGEFKQETALKCSDGDKPEIKPLKIGAHIMEAEAPTVPNGDGYFEHNHARCRLFREHYDQNGKFRTAHGVICELDNNDWLVVDKW